MPSPSRASLFLFAVILVCPVHSGNAFAQTAEQIKAAMDVGAPNGPGPLQPERRVEDLSSKTCSEEKSPADCLMQICKSGCLVSQTPAATAQSTCRTDAARGWACHALGRLIEAKSISAEQSLVAVGPTTQSDLYREACRYGFSAGCIDWGKPRDGRDAVDAFCRACYLGDPDGCLLAGVSIYKHAGTAVERAEKLWAKACELGDASACFRSAVRKKDKSQRLAEELMHKGNEAVKKECDILPSLSVCAKWRQIDCSGDLNEECLKLFPLPSKPRYVRMLSEAEWQKVHETCEQGDIAVCIEAALESYEGRFNKLDMAKYLLANAAAAGEPRSLGWLSRIFQDLGNVERSEALKALFEKGCRDKNYEKSSCEADPSKQYHLDTDYVAPSDPRHVSPRTDDGSY